MSGFGRATPPGREPEQEPDRVVRDGETPEERLARARAALAEAEALATAPPPDDAERTASRSTRTSARGASGRPTGGSSRRAAPRSRRGAPARRSGTAGRPEREGGRGGEIDLSSWPGAGPAPDWVPEAPAPDTSSDESSGGAGQPAGRRGRAARPRDAGVRDVESGGSEDAASGVEVDPHEEAARARQVVLRQLAMAPRSRAQLVDKLAAKDIDPDIADEVLDRFEEVGLVDDAAFAEVLVRSQQESRGLSKRGLRHELRKKGVDPDIVEDALAPLDAESERARAEDLVATRMRRLHGLPREVQMRRLAGFLARKGYPGDLAFSVIRQALDAAEEHRRD